MRGGTKKSAGLGKPGKATAKLRSAPETRGKKSKLKRTAAAALKSGASKFTGNGTTPDKMLTRLRGELDEARAQQAATAEILEMINRWPGDPAPVFDAILEKAMRLCDAAFGGLLVPDGEFIKYLTFRNVPEGFTNFLTHNRIRARTMFGPNWASGALFNIADLSQSEGYGRRVPVTVSAVEDGGIRAVLLVPMMKEGAFVGAFTIYRQEVRPFTERQIALAQSFAAQAAIAIENARLLTELGESLDRQTAMSEVLRVISASPGNVQPVFEKMLECALRLCRAHMGTIHEVTDGALTQVAKVGVPPEFSFELNSYHPPPDTPLALMLMTKSTIRVDDYRATEGYAAGNPASVALVDQGGGRSGMQVPMVKEGEVVGAMTIYRPEVHPFDEQDATIAEDFAKQAVIAIENARLLSELRKTTGDLQESLEYQTATSDVLKVISRSTFDLQPVLDTLLQTAARLCNSDAGGLTVRDDDVFRYTAFHGHSDEFIEVLRARPVIPGRDTVAGRTVLEAQVIQIADLSADPSYGWHQVASLKEVGSTIGVPMLRGTEVIGTFSLSRKHVEPYTDRQIELVRTFADHAVIAIENARLLEEINKRQAELSVTFDNMGDAVMMFDAEQRLIAWNRNFLHMLEVPEEWLATPQTYNSLVQYMTARGEFGDTPPPDIDAPDTGEVRPIRYERVRPNGRVLEVRRNPVSGNAGFVFIYSDITERKLAEQSILAAREAAEHALADLKLVQANLIQSEKMASLGALTAGIAHEIKNPLNFVNNFASLSNELLTELKETTAPAFATLDADKRDEIDETMQMLTGNLRKIQEHGRRADGIVKSMLAHSRGGSGDRREGDVNALVEESLNLAYHGARAQDQNFNITLERDYDKAMRPIELVPQDMTRVFLNLCGNGFYAANKRRKEGGDEMFRPVLKIATRELGDAVEVRIRDNGIGIPPEIKDKLFQPFFTTKPTGEGTGLGLSISYEIVTQQHGGTIAVDSRVGDFTEFTIHLPRKR